MNTHYLDLLKELQIDNEETPIFIETGTHKGAGTEAWASVFDEVHTIELSDSLYEYCCKTYDFPNVTFIHGASTDVLEELVKTVDKPYILFLDAHGSGGDTAYHETVGRLGSPVLLEIECVKNNPPKYILVDDMADFGGGTNYPSQDSILKKIYEIGDYELLSINLR